MKVHAEHMREGRDDFEEVMQQMGRSTRSTGEGCVDAVTQAMWLEERRILSEQWHARQKRQDRMYYGASIVWVIGLVALVSWITYWMLKIS